MYKDKDKQREANRQAQVRFKAKKVLAEKGVSSQVLPDVPRVSDQDFTKLLAQAGPGHVRVSKPGDADYEPQCETTKAFVGKDHSMECDPKILAEFRESKTSPKRGKDIKTFEDLPPDVQQTIRTISDTDEEFKRRPVIAIAYQHTFPGRY